MPIPSCEFKNRKHVNVISYAERKEESLLGTVESRGEGEVRRHVELGLRRKMEYRSVPVRFLPSTLPPPPPPRSRGSISSCDLPCLLACLAVVGLGRPYIHQSYYMYLGYPIYIRALSEHVISSRATSLILAPDEPEPSETLI